MQISTTSKVGPLSPASVNGQGGRTSNEQHMFGFLREIRASAQNLQLILIDVQHAVVGKDVAGRAAAYAKLLTKNATVSATVMATAQKALDGIRTLFTVDAGTHDWCSDDIIHIETQWTQIKNEWPSAASGIDDVEAAIPLLLPMLDSVVYKCESLTLSPRVNDILANLRVGQGVRFLSIFDDELPASVELKQKLFVGLVEQSGSITNGYLDEDNRIIWRVAASRARQWWSVIRLGLLFLVGFGLLLLACWLGTAFSMEGWPFRLDDVRARMLALGLVFVGGFIHLIIAALKDARAQSQPLRSPWNDWVLWLHARESRLAASILTLFVGYAGLSSASTSLSWQTAFFAGYSIDSVIDVVLDRFDRFAGAQTKRIVDDARGSAGPGAATGAVTTADHAKAIQ